ncbi:MAG TPA: alpha-glucosidase [Terracidiphilus sp.]|jgi:alpha-glucosidase
MHFTRKAVTFTAALLFIIGVLSAAAQPSDPAAYREQNWWRNAVFYEIYPRSFQDTNKDGIGDLKGIIQHLDYLKDLGVDAIWLTPIYPSPQVDFGYDISDYEAIDPKYGTMADFDRLIAEANKRHIHVLMDMVMNHTSDKHKWFLQSRSSNDNPYRDWYVWHEGKGQTASDKGQPPNNWQSVFGHSAWEWDDKTRQYYYHKFYIQQPDLNWNNPKVHQAFKDIIDFWLKKGVGGFRFDAITTLFEDPQMRDEELVVDKNGQPVINAYGDQEVKGNLTDNLPGVHTVMEEMRAEADKFSTGKYPGTRVFIGETYLPNVAELLKQYGTDEHPEFELPMDTQILLINKMDASGFRTRLEDAETELGTNVPLLVFDNHDNPRIDARYGDGVHDTDIERVLSTVLFASRGAALFYNGDEIGMKTTPPTRKEDVKDPIGITGWPKEKGRDGERTPMQWTSGPNAGFTAPTVKPWLPVPPNNATINVDAEKADPKSLYNWYKALIQLKKTNPAFAEGEDTMLDVDNTNVLSWKRQAPGAPPVVIAVNFTAEPQTVGLAGPGMPDGAVNTLLKTPDAPAPASLKNIQLGPFGVYIGQLQFMLSH